MSLDTLNTSRMIISPSDPEVAKKFFKLVGEPPESIDRDDLARYILLMYDPNSPLVELVDDYWSRKFDALELAGFKQRNGKFEPKVESFVLGKSNEVNDIVIDWLIYIAKPKWTHLVFLCESLIRYTRQAEDGINENKIAPADVKAVNEIMDKMAKVVHEWLFKGDETKEFLERLYYKTHRELLKVHPEDYAKKLASGDNLDGDSPYGKYKVEKLKFAGSKIPEEAPRNVLVVQKRGRPFLKTPKVKRTRKKKL